MGYHLTGNDKDAQTHLEAALNGISEDEPNPLAYRTRTAMAEILLAANDMAGAGKQLDQVLTTDNPGYFPARIMQARVVLKFGDADKALTLLEAVKKEVDSPEVNLLIVEAACTSTKNANAKQKAEAIEFLKKDKDKLGPAEEVGRVAAICDPKLPAELGVPVPAGTPGAAPAPVKAPPKAPPKRGRGGRRR
jgi:predicted Zn-dependent protease